MKKLSEIGTYCTPSPHSYTQYEPYWTFSKEERREFAERVVRLVMSKIVQRLEACDYEDTFSGSQVVRMLAPYSFGEFLGNEGI
jgi:hypothetical protein